MNFHEFFKRSDCFSCKKCLKKFVKNSQKRNSFLVVASGEQLTKTNYQNFKRMKGPLFICWKVSKYMIR